MNIICEKVHHDMFGKGTVIEQNETVVKVKFEKPHGVKQFIYPSAFGTFLTLADIQIQEKINVKIKQMNEQAESERVAREEEMSQRRKEDALSVRKAKMEARKSAVKNIKK